VASVLFFTILFNTFLLRFIIEDLKACCKIGCQ
jgi:hypothetical protein